MKAFPWIVAGAGLALAAYFVLNQPDPQIASDDDGVEDVAGKIAVWGSKRSVKGTGGDLVGRLKEGLGQAAGDTQLKSEGVVDQAVGTLEDTAGRAAHAAADTIHDLNH